MSMSRPGSPRLLMPRRFGKDCERAPAPTKRLGHTECTQMSHFALLADRGRQHRAALFGFALTGLLGCSEAVQVGRNFGGGGALPALGGASGMSPDPAVGDAASPEPAPPRQPYECVEAECRGMMLECGNCDDDDGDGLIDAADPECLGPCDNSEAELFSGRGVAVNRSCRADCYFDTNSGRGNDSCDWSYSCDPLSVGPNFYPTGLERCEHDGAASVCQPSPSQTAACQAGCLPLTPNGCDCFGCCELPAGSNRFVWLGSENLDLAHCELETSGEEALCKPCTPVPGCQNECEECELCVGKPRLPDACGAGLPDGSEVLPLCPNGQACNPDNPITCTRLEYCVTGCCVPLPT